MPTYRFPAEAGLALDGGALTADAINHRLSALGLTREGITVSRNDDAVTLEGRLPDEATRERVLLAVGNLQGVARVDDRMTVAQAREGLLGTLGAFARLPSGSATIEAAERSVHAARPDSDARFGPGGSILHVVQPGETLEAIAARHYHDTAAAGWILESNDLVVSDASALRPGMVLRLPPR